MLQDGLEKVLAGITTFEEIYKNVAIDNELDAKYAEEINNNIKLEPITKSNTNTVIDTNETINNEALDLI